MNPRIPLTNEQARSIGNKIRTAEPEEYLRLIKEKGERRAQKARRYPRWPKRDAV